MIYIIFLAMVLLDRLSKLYISNNFVLGESQIIIEGMLQFTYVRNTGIAFGLLAGRGWLLILLQALVIALLLVFKLRYFPSQMLVNFCFAALMAGAISNLLDRILYGYVIDFVDIGIWPVFNLADVFIVAGAAGLILLILKEEIRTVSRKNSA